MKLAITAIAILLLAVLFISTASAERQVTVVRGNVVASDGSAGGSVRTRERVKRDRVRSGGSDGFSARGSATVRTVARERR